MKSIRNYIQLIGRLGSEPEFVNLENGNRMIKMRLATNEFYKNNQGEKIKDTQWHNVIAWGRTAENMKVFLKMGNEIAINGKLSYTSYKDKNGTKQLTSQIVADEFMLLSQGKKESIIV